MKNQVFMFVLGLIIFVAAICTVLLTGGALQAFIHIPSILFVAGAAGGLGLAVYKGGGLFAYIAACKKHFISAGVLGAVIGVVQMLHNLEHPSQMGMGVAVALLTIFYGIVFYCLAEALLSKPETPEAKV